MEDTSVTLIKAGFILLATIGFIILFSGNKKVKNEKTNNYKL